MTLPDNIRPELDEVGAILRARTFDTDGTETGTFGTDTRPTGDEVVSYIDQAVPDVRLKLPVDIPDDLESYVRRLVALRAGMFVELSYAEDQGGEHTSYARLKDLFDSGLAALLAALKDRGEDVTTSGRLVSATLASPYGGPVDDDPLI